MIEKKVEHPLRTIVLNYDETKTPLAFEKGLLDAYINLHDETNILYQQGSKLIYEYQLMKPEIEQSAKAFAPIEKIIRQFLEELKFTKESNDIAIFEDDDFFARMNDYNTQINDFHQNILLPLSWKQSDLDEEYHEFETNLELLNKKLDDYQLNLGNEIYINYEEASLDLVSYDIDIDDFHSTMDKLNDYQDEKDASIDKYNLNMNWINGVYVEARQIQEIIHDMRDKDGLLDKSLSDSYANGTLEKDKMPMYLMEPTDDVVANFKNLHGTIALPTVTTIIMAVSVDIIESGENMVLCDFIAGLQHYPKLIEKSLFAVRIDILDKDETILTEDQWKGFPPPMRWFFNLSCIPFSLFFLEDHDARAYVVMGDYFADKNVTGDGERVAISGEMLKEVTNRLFQACYFFMVYCHNTGFNPESYIKAVLADFDFPLTYENVKEKFEADLLLGIHVRLYKGTR